MKRDDSTPTVDRPQTLRIRPVIAVEEAYPQVARDPGSHHIQAAEEVLRLERLQNWRVPAGGVSFDCEVCSSTTTVLRRPLPVLRVLWDEIGLESERRIVPRLEVEGPCAWYPVVVCRSCARLKLSRCDAFDRWGPSERCALVGAFGRRGRCPDHDGPKSWQHDYGWEEEVTGGFDLAKRDVVSVAVLRHQFHRSP